MRESAFVASIYHVIEQYTVPLLRTNGPQDVDVHRILDHPMRIPGRKRDILNYLVMWVIGIHLTVSNANQFLIRPCRSERCATKRWCLGALNDDADNAGRSAVQKEKEEAAQQHLTSARKCSKAFQP